MLFFFKFKRGTEFKPDFCRSYNLCLSAKSLERPAYPHGNYRAARREGYYRHALLCLSYSSISRPLPFRKYSKQISLPENPYRFQESGSVVFVPFYRYAVHKVTLFETPDLNYKHRRQQGTLQAFASHILIRRL